MNRRGFLITAVGLAAFLSAVTTIGPYTKRATRFRINTQSPVGKPVLHELKTLYAISEVFAPSAKKAPRQYVYDYISLLYMTKRGFLNEFRAAVHYIDELSANTYNSTLFINLSGSNQKKLIKNNFLTKKLTSSSLTSKLYRRTLATRGERSFSQFISKQLKTIIYSSSLGWQTVGYEHYQGTPAADPLEYTTPPLVKS